MTWLKVDDALHGHPKVEQAGLAAVGLWVRCGSWSSAYLTDGHLPETIVKRFGRARDVDQLVDCGLWIPEPGGWVMHDFLDYNPSAQQVRAERAKARRRRAAQRADQLDLFTEAPR